MTNKFTSILLGKIVATMALSLASTSLMADDATTIIFYEDFGTASSEKDEAIEDHVWATNSSDYFSWVIPSDDDNINVRTNNASDYDGASADGNLYFKGSATFTISGINTADYSNVGLSFGAFGKNKKDVECMTLTITSADGQATEVDFGDLDLDTSKKTWSVATISDVPSTESLQLSFTSSLDVDDDGGIRLDDIKLTGEAISTGITSLEEAPIMFQVEGSAVLSSTAADIYSLSGRRVASVKAGVKATLPSSGMYIIRCETGASKVVVR